MTSTTFFHEFKETYRWVLKKNLGILILLAVLMFLAIPLLLFMTIPGWTVSAQSRFTAEAERLRSMRSFFASFMGFAPAAATVLTFIFSAVLCVVLFGYMQKKRSVDLYHALPVRREALLLGRWCAGATILFAPLLLNFFILWATQAAFGIGVNGWVIFRPMLTVMLMTAAVFTSCVFMAVCSGTMLDTALSVIGVNAGYPLLMLCVFTIANNLLPGVNLSTNGHTAILTALAPFAAGFVLFFSNQDVWFHLWWIALTLVMLWGSVFLYNRRKSESAESNFAFPIPKILIRFLLTAVGGMGFGLILGIQIGNTINFFIGVVAGSLIAHIVVEGVYSRGFKQLKKSFRWYGVFAAVFLLFYGILATGFFGYDTRIPSAGEVKNVSVDTDVNFEYNGGSGCNVIYDEKGSMLKSLSPVLTEPESIETVLKSQNNVVQLYRANGYPYLLRDTVGNMLTVNYRLRNGRSFTRSYQYYSFSDDRKAKTFRQAFKPITDLKEYTEQLDMIFYLEPADIKTVDINRTDKENSGKVVVPDDAKKAELMAALRLDFLQKKINYIPGTENGMREFKTIEPLSSLTLEFNSNIEPKSDRLKTLLGSYKGKINLNGSNEYNIYDKSSAVYALMRKYGWLS